MAVEELFPDGYVISCPKCDGDVWQLSFVNNDTPLGVYHEWNGLIRMSCANPECDATKVVFMDSDLEFYRELSKAVLEFLDEMPE